jgi:hypothetical protein
MCVVGSGGARALYGRGDGLLACIGVNGGASALAPLHLLCLDTRGLLVRDDCGHGRKEPSRPKGYVDGDGDEERQGIKSKEKPL